MGSDSRPGFAETAFSSRMNITVLATLAASGFSVAFIHAALPTHWLPFVLVARARGWRERKTMGVAAVASLGHIAITSLLGLGVALLGREADAHFGEWFRWIAGGVLLVVGVYFAVQQWRGAGLRHHHLPGGHHHPSEACGHEKDTSHLEHELRESPLVEKKTGDWAAISGLLVMLTLSPCEAFLPVYLSGAEFGWTGFFVLSGILAAGTMGGMTIFTWMTLRGLSRFDLRKVERFEAGMLAAVFLLLGAMMLLIDHGHGHAH
jgi:ABC-type nickel/cobalt efflux system permease component RcnA